MNLPTARTGDPVFDEGLSVFPVSEASAHASAVQAMLRGTKLGLVVRGVFQRAHCAAFIEALEDGSSGAPKAPSIGYAGASWGRLLALQPPDLDAYLATAPAMRALCIGPDSILERLRTVLEALAGGRTFSVPVHGSGRAYVPFTARKLEPGGSLLTHCENETAGRGNLEDLARGVDLSSQISFYVLLRRPERAGRLVIYPLRFGDPSGARIHASAREWNLIEPLVKGSPVITPDMDDGDLLVFDAGRYYHRIEPVEGDRARWTLGGLFSEYRDGRGLAFWS